ncbi:phosphorothioated DNA-binding restriction endonuclease [Piscinibacter sakaiensis]|uniref:phosphorothioated DNA-binding restriction endonuclease n=1 Tax=Piscinibacter sakaiensis TaxID=1547922 RepID=UPI003AB0C7FC
MADKAEILTAFQSIRRAQIGGRYAPHKPLLILLALGRVQRGEPRLVAFSAIDGEMKALLQDFAPRSAVSSRHYPFWHLATDGQGTIWDLMGPKDLLTRPPAATPSLGELRSRDVEGGFPPPIDDALRNVPGLIEAVAQQLLDSCFPETLHSDIAAAVGLRLDPVPQVGDAAADGVEYTDVRRARRDRTFRERILRAYEYRCCVCGFDLRIGQTSAGLEAAHIRWHHLGGPDVEKNGLSLCALHHKLFDLGVFTVEPMEQRVVYSQHAIAGDRGADGELRYHGRTLLPPQHPDLLPAPEFLGWNHDNVFKKPGRVFQP